MTTITDILVNFFSNYPENKFKKSDKLFYPGDKIDKAFYIKEGFVREYSISKEGTELTLHLYKAGSFLPMTAIISDIKNRYYFEVFTNSTLIAVPKQDLLNFLHFHPPALFDLTSRLLVGLDKMLLRIEFFAYKTSYARVISALIFLYGHFGIKTDQKATFNQKFTHNEIAAFAGVSRETVTRELKKLKDENFIEFTSKGILMDIDALKSVIK